MDDRQSQNGRDANRREGLYSDHDLRLRNGRPIYSPPAQHYDYAMGGPAPGGFSFTALLRTLLPHWVTILLFVVLSAVGGFFYIARTTPIYAARAELEMSVRRPKVINNDAVFEDPSTARDSDVIFNTRFAKFTSPSMEELAAKEYIKRYPEHAKTRDGMTISKATLALCIREAKWKKDPDANIVYVSYETADPEFASRLVNVLSHCAGMLMMQENQAISDEAVKWLVSQAQEQRESLEEVEKELATLREQLQLDSLEQRKVALGQALVTVSEEKEALISNLASRKTIYDFVSELKGSGANLEMLPSGLPKEAELNEMIRAWREANDNLMQVADRYTEIHPEYRSAAEIEARSRKRLEQFIDLSAKTVQKEIELLDKQLEQVEARISAMKAEAIELEQALASGLRQIQRLERKRDAADTAYQAMLNRMEEARLSADENMAFAKVIREASIPRMPIHPRKARVMILSVVLGTIGGVFLTLIIAFWTDTINSVADLKAMGLNVVAVIPSQKKIDSRAELATIGLRDKFNPIVEIFAGITALLSSERFAGQSKLIVAASVGPGEGKTISACNMAISSAANGSRTLLIDGDLRRPRLASIFNIDEQHPSLLEWLAKRGELRHDELVTKDVSENLDVITSRPHNDINPAELLGRESLVDLLAWARENYDRVIIDSPPLGPVGDTQVLANLVDAVVLVARVGKTKRRALRFGLTRFSAIDAPVLGCIANDVPHSLVGMFGGGEGYGYGPGYQSYGRG